MDPRYNKLIDILLSNMEENKFQRFQYGNINKQSYIKETFVLYLSNRLSAFAGTCLRESIDEMDARLVDEGKCRDLLSRLEPGRLDELWKKLSEIIFAESTGTTQLKLETFIKDPFFSSPPIPPVDNYQSVGGAQVEATIAAWNKEYVGSTSDELWEHVKDRYASQGSDGQYGNFCAIIQSSGTGKSRAVDEMSRKHFVINICLRQGGAMGFPPSDDDLLLYFTSKMKDPAIAADRIDAFLTSLFTVTLKHVTDLATSLDAGVDEYQTLANIFRVKMTEGQQMTRTNQSRSAFYNEVITGAEALLGQTKAARNPASSCTTLSGFFRKLRGCNQAPKDDPLIIIAFDESAVLAESKEDIPPVLSKLRRQLSELNKQSLFSLFLSTTGHITEFLSPTGLPDASNRIVMREKRLNPAFTFCPFDAFARKTDDILTIDEVSGEMYMMHLGRPLWATRLDSVAEFTHKMLRIQAMEFAITKLLNTKNYMFNYQYAFSATTIIACLAQRLPIEFQTSMNLEYQTSLVENHMRICLILDPRSDRMVTVSASEPILSEAAFVVMQHPDCKIEEGLRRLLTGFSISKGDRGELLALLLFILARDAAVRGLNDFRMWETPELYEGSDGLEEWKRVLSVEDFISNLFKGLDEKITSGIRKDFAGVNMHFNHFVKGNAHSIVNRKYLVRMLARGAGLLCATNQEGIDAIIPCLRGKHLREEDITPLLAQFKNNAKYSSKPVKSLFDAMCPIKLGIVDPENAPEHIIRIVFAMAAKTPSLRAECVKVKGDGYSYIAYNIWCAGLQSEFLVPITSRTTEEWNTALDASRGPDDMYTIAGKKGMRDHLFTMNPATRDESGFWENFFPLP